MTAGSSAWPDVEVWTQQVFAARNANEARLFVQCQGGTEAGSSAVGTELHILASHPEGERVHRFTLGAGAPWEPTDFGAGTSRILDPAELVFFADDVVRGVPPTNESVHPRAVVRQLRLAAAALREAAKLIPAGGIEEAAFFTGAARSYALANPGRFSIDQLQRYAAEIDAHADAWQRL